jgi:hypothetical protein
MVLLLPFWTYGINSMAGPACSGECKDGGSFGFLHGQAAVRYFYKKPG